MDPDPAAQLARALEQNKYTLPCMWTSIYLHSPHPCICAIAVYVILLWEALINLGEEHDLIHQTRWGHVKVCYLACRYYPIIITPLYLWACIADIDPRTCASIVLPLQIFLLPLVSYLRYPSHRETYCIHLAPDILRRNLVVILVRAYGFTGRNLYVLLLLCGCFVTLLFLQFWGFANQSLVARKVFAVLGTCQGYKTTSNDFSHTRHVGYVMVASIATDALALIVVSIHCFRIRTTQGPLGRLFLQQGISGFLVMLTLNIVSAFTFLGPDHLLTFGVVYPLMFPNIIACRFILQLRRQVSPTETFQLRRQSQLVRDAVGVAHDPQPPDPGSGPPHISIPLEDYYLRPMPTAHQLLPQHNIYFHSYHPRDPPSFSIPKP
ncbi:hypothetical protein PC9H_006491 [Pleurotus ostreatus]|uniref:DUF6533 domain-containing protein n=1 Tax=Pleurotus ostreatus TaxID=5322 RepID=A0A8H6ZWS8_PLEOS|nr:uncharacterized protein PC9H_006491 [Pleurotus ostreatus]KAF7430780.1 hypothetical protein PC9H_006491 [Pleurotus ostreatus]